MPIRSSQYYRSNPRAFSVREVARSSGLVRFPFAYIASRFMKPRGQTWLPYLWADLCCTRQDLSERFFRATAAQRNELDRLGFAEITNNKAKRALGPEVLDTGGTWYLGGSRRHFCALSYGRLQGQSPYAEERELVVVVFTAVFQKEAVICTNDKNHFDPAPKRQVFLYSTQDVGLLHPRFLAQISKRSEPPREFPDVNALQTWFDSNSVELLEHHLSRGLYIPMSEAELKHPRHAPPPPLPRGPNCA